MAETRNSRRAGKSSKSRSDDTHAPPVTDRPSPSADPDASTAAAQAQAASNHHRPSSDHQRLPAGAEVFNGSAWTKLTVPQYLSLRRLQARGVFYERICDHLKISLERVRIHYRWFAITERANVCIHLARFFDGEPPEGATTDSGETRAWRSQAGNSAIEFIGDFRCRYEDDNYTTPIYIETFKTSPHEARECFADGTLLIRYKGVPLAIRLEFAEIDEPGKLTIYGPSTEQGIALVKEVYENLEHRITEFPIYAGHIITPNARFLDLEDHQWDELILDPVKLKQLRRNTVELLEKLPLYQRNKLPLKRGLILAGPPGTGKTLAGKVLARDLAGRRLTLPLPRNRSARFVRDSRYGAPPDPNDPDAGKLTEPIERPTTFVWISPKDIDGPYSVEGVYNLARRCAPAVVFFEDMDLYIKDREDGYRDNPILGEFLNQLDGPVENSGVITILTTNYLDSIEQALKDRPGRFDVIIEFGLPNASCRERLLRRYTANHKNIGVRWRKMAEMTDGLSGAQIRELIMQAAIFALEGGSLDDNQQVILRDKFFQKALTTVAAKTTVRIGFSPARSDSAG